MRRRLPGQHGGLVAWMAFFWMTCSTPPAPPKMLVLGLDGATWGVFEPLIQAGRMPNLARLRQRGTWGVLRAAVDFSPPAWASITTGLLASRHGLWNFFVDPYASSRKLRDEEIPYFWKPRPEDLAKLRFVRQAGSMHVHGTRFWELAGRNGLSWGVVGMLHSFPALDPLGREAPGHGFILSGDGTPAILEATSPSESPHWSGTEAGGMEAEVGATEGLARELGGAVRVRWEESAGRWTATGPEGTTRPGLTLGQTAWLPARLPVGDRAVAVLERSAPWGPALVLGHGAWSGFEPPAAEILLPSGIAPENVGYRTDLPVFLIPKQGLEAGGSPVPGLFSWNRSRAASAENVRILGLELRAVWSREADGILVRLAAEETPETRFEFLVGSTLRGRPEGAAQWIAEETPLRQAWWLWLLGLRARERNGTALEGWRGLRLKPGPRGMQVDWTPLYDAWTDSLAPLAAPSDLLAGLEPPADLASIDILHNLELLSFWAREVFQRRPVEVRVVLWTFPDVVLHQRWTTGSAADLESTSYDERIALEMERLDRELGKLLEQAGEQTQVVLVSDHGLQRGKGSLQLNLNLALEALGFLHAGGAGRGWKLFGTGPASRTVDPASSVTYVCPDWGPAALCPEAGLWVQDAHVAEVQDSLAKLCLEGDERLDLRILQSETKACPSAWPGKTCDKLVLDAPPVEWLEARQTRAVHSCSGGPALGQLGDWLEADPRGVHNNLGIYLFAGPGIPHALQGPPAPQTDFVPTLLRLLRLPPAPELAGIPIPTVVGLESLEPFERRRLQARGKKAPREEAPALDPELEEQLRKIGYLPS